MKGKTAEDLYALLEREVRSPADRLLLDAFLPAPETIPSALYKPAPPAPPEGEAAAGATAVFSSAPEGGVSRERTAEDPPARRRPRPRKAAEPQRSLEEEIADFMSQRGTALAPDSDPEK